MKKFMSLLMAAVMILGLSVTTMAASSEGVTVDGWNGWTVTSGSAVTVTDSARGTVVKVSGAAERYFARQFRGAYELSVDVIGAGTVSFADSNGRNAASAVLADGSINGASCAYDADAWNTVKMFVLPGERSAEIYLGDTYVTKYSFTTVSNPTKLVVSSNSEICVDNISVSGMHRASAYTDGELTLIEKTDLSKGMGNWYGQANVEGISFVELDKAEFNEPVIKVEKKVGTSSSITRLKYNVNTTGNLVLEAEMYLPSNEAYTVTPTLSMRCQRVNGVEGRALTLVDFQRDGFPAMGCNGISALSYSDKPFYSEDEWFKFKIEMLTESQSMNLYIAKKNANGSYGEFIRVNGEPVYISNRDGSDPVRETYKDYLNWEFEINRSASHSALFYLKNMKISKLADEEIVTVFSEDFENYNPATSRLQYVNTNPDAGSYLTLEAADISKVNSANTENKAAPSGKVGKMRFSGVGRTGTDYTVHVVEGYQMTESVNLNYAENADEIIVPSTAIAERNPDTEYFRVKDLDIRDNVKRVQFTFDYFDAAVARKKSAANNARGSLYFNFSNSSDIQKTLVGYYFTGSSIRLWTSVKDHGLGDMLLLQNWEAVEGNIYPWGTVNNGAENVQVVGYRNNDLSFRSAWIKDTDIDAEAIGSINEMRIYVPSFEGGMYYMDNIKIKAYYPIGGNGYFRRTYSAYETYTDAVERGELEDIKLGYVEFKDASGNAAGAPFNGGSVKSVSIEKNASLPEGSKLLVAAYNGDVLSGAEIIPVTSQNTYNLTTNIPTTDASVVKVFLWNMTSLVPVIGNEVVDMDNRTTLVLFGDSLVDDYHSGGREYPVWGWGEKLGDYLNTNKLRIVNKAKSGASSADYLGKDYKVSDHTGLYADGLNALGEGDYAIISLTTNDSSRFSIDKFKANIQEMVDDIKEAGATPILATAHPRCNYTTVAETSSTRFADQNYYSFGMILKALAEENEIPFIDLYQMAIDKYDTGVLDSVYADYYVGYTNPSTPTQDDRTHLTEKGADSAASLVAKGIAQLDCGIEDFVR